MDEKIFYQEKNKEGDSNQYQTPEGFAKYEIRKKTIKIKDTSDVVLTVKSSRHGPIMNDLLDRLDSIITLLEQDKSIGLVGINMLDANQNYIPAAGNFPNFRNMFQFQKLLDLGIEFKNGKFSKEHYEVGWLSGSFLFLSKETYIKINGFDEDYFMYVEDVDFCKKVANIGLKRVFIPGLSYIHYVGFNKKKNPMLVKGYKIYINKHFKGIPLLLISIALTINSFVKNIKSRF